MATEDVPAPDDPELEEITGKALCQLGFVLRKLEQARLAALGRGLTETAQVIEDAARVAACELTEQRSNS